MTEPSKSNAGAIGNPGRARCQLTKHVSPIHLSLVASLVLGLSGCSFSGLDGSSSFACSAPDGILCESMSGIYVNALAKKLPGQRQAASRAGDFRTTGMEVKGLFAAPLTSGTPLRTAPRILRVWLAPWQDADGDLHDQSYLYVQVDGGRWAIEHNQARIVEQYRALPSESRSPSAGTLGDVRLGDDQDIGAQHSGAAVVQANDGGPISLSCSGGELERQIDEKEVAPPASRSSARNDAETRQLPLSAAVAARYGTGLMTPQEAVGQFPQALDAEMPRPE